MTFSIVARCPRTGALGMAVASASLACASFTVHVKGGVGAIASQATSNPFYGPDGLRLLAAGKNPDEVIAAVTSIDPARDLRQLLIVDAAGRSAAFTGSGCTTRATHAFCEGYAVGGNRLADDVVEEMARSFEMSAEEALPERLMQALEAGQVAGGDRGGRQSAGLVVSDHPDYATFNLRVDDHLDPVGELRRLVGLRADNRSTYDGFRPTREQPLPPGFVENWASIKMTLRG
ncbi:MAG TPA: DUF1028 domain-containing protein [Dehalococcoidia bacterium]|nr:DUF1028 domain-containing protein [Dehalococcoidia bacterium]